ncbi:hypothetical protein CONPUDRAFT_150128 [Coniophora puteana RWD-64-598 SS2]|uniref:Uncharacterized protein n=1 Tax=Coniophora puteana (strain RWD-64-598) TaxID=741705 RepID=A0A5M3N1N8_CONPW|nr:uncharacterized protein CONPUDRAFT_150128 [Coniophora puteana RWD-64-598 SS2]EIW85312.1 hypothetical protein CONPUDRAFT_150128 [Coniophora puteana RWD-64-598 SS2]
MTADTHANRGINQGNWSQQNPGFQELLNFTAHGGSSRRQSKDKDICYKGHHFYKKGKHT